MAVSLGGDSDTLACITGGIAEAFYRYRIPYGIRSKVLSLLDDDLRRIVKEFIDARRECLYILDGKKMENQYQ